MMMSSRFLNFLPKLLKFKTKKEGEIPLLSHNFSQEEAHLSFLLFYGYFIG